MVFKCKNSYRAQSITLLIFYVNKAILKIFILLSYYVLWCVPSKLMQNSCIASNCDNATPRRLTISVNHQFRHSIKFWISRKNQLRQMINLESQVQTLLVLLYSELYVYLRIVMILKIARTNLCLTAYYSPVIGGNFPKHILGQFLRILPYILRCWIQLRGCLKK